MRAHAWWNVTKCVTACVLRDESPPVQDALSAFGFPEHKKQAVIDSIEFMEACQAFLETPYPSEAQEHGSGIQTSCSTPLKHATDDRDMALKPNNASHLHELTGRPAVQNFQQGVEAAQGR